MNQEKENFDNRIKEFIASILKYKKDNQNKWYPEYDNLINELNDILDISDMNYIDAKNRFDELPCSRYCSFNNYISNTTTEFIKKSKYSIERTKTLRAKRRTTKCPKCNSDLIFDGIMICKNCGYEDMKSIQNNNKILSNNTKHISKQLESLCGLKKLPANILKTIQYIILWLTDLHYIHDWLIYMNKMERFQQKYLKITSLNLEEEWFYQILDRTKENYLSFKLYKLMMDEYYLLTEHCNKLYNMLKNSNMNRLDTEEILEIFDKWCKTHHKIPVINDIINYKTNIYEIGLYMNELSLIVDFDEDHIKNKIINIFKKYMNVNNTDFNIPGLIFNWDSVYKLGENVCRRYTYCAEYCGIINYVFNVGFIKISPGDMEILENIISRFNQFYKEETTKTTNTKNNSPLFCCTITCIITQLSYFNKYRDILKYIPDKYMNSMTSDSINKKWLEFIISNPDVIKSYRITENVQIENQQNNDNIDLSINDFIQYDGIL